MTTQSRKGGGAAVPLHTSDSNLTLCSRQSKYQKSLSRWRKGFRSRINRSSHDFGIPTQEGLKDRLTSPRDPFLRVRPKTHPVTLPNMCVWPQLKPNKTTLNPKARSLKWSRPELTRVKRRSMPQIWWNKPWKKANNHQFWLKLSNKLSQSTIANHFWQNREFKLLSSRESNFSENQRPKESGSTTRMRTPTNLLRKLGSINFTKFSTSKLLSRSRIRSLSKKRRSNFSVWTRSTCRVTLSNRFRTRWSTGFRIISMSRSTPSAYRSLTETWRDK